MSRLSDRQIAEIKDAQSQIAATKRPTVAAIEEIMFEPLPVLDQGFVRVIDYLGDDAAIVQGARVSYGKGTKQVSTDRNLIRYLLRHRHTSPFELAVLKLHVRAPIFVTRQWFRHRTAAINEYSARYSVLEREFYVPSVDAVSKQSSSNRQGRGDVVDPALAERVVDILKTDAARCYDNYLWMLNEDEQGNRTDPDRDSVARELARINLPVGVMTQFYWQINLWNLLHFLRLRADAHAQYEIRAYAHAILEVVKRWVPLVHEAFQDYVANGAHLSGQALHLVRAALRGEAVDPDAVGLSRRELAELFDAIPELQAVTDGGGR